MVEKIRNHHETNKADLLRDVIGSISEKGQSQVVSFPSGHIGRRPTPSASRLGQVTLHTSRPGLNNPPQVFDFSPCESGERWSCRGFQDQGVGGACVIGSVAIWNTKESLFLFFFLAANAACRILVPQPGIKPVPPTMEVQSLNHWTAREVLRQFCKCGRSIWIVKGMFS